MRTTLWAGLLATAAYNQSRQMERVRIFESGLRFIPQDTDLKQERMLSGLVCGSAVAEQWGVPARAVDFFDVKADVEALLALRGGREAHAFTPGEHPALHPGQCAVVTRGEAVVGYVGLLHPRIEKELDLVGPVYLFELCLEALGDGRLPQFAPLSKFPSIRRDLALVVERAVPFARVEECARRAAPAIVQEIRLFDVYMGEKIDSGLKSLALGLILQDSSDTLTDQKVDAAVQGILQALSAELGARLRD
jgi:phenylalanyl-tRNA synthetase beta chain